MKDAPVRDGHKYLSSDNSIDHANVAIVGLFFIIHFSFYNSFVTYVGMWYLVDWLESGASCINTAAKLRLCLKN